MRSQSSLFLKQLFIAFLGVVFLLVLVESGVRYAIRNTRLLETPVDIQTPAILLSKLNYISQLEGKKIVLIGDSLMFGRSMRDHGNHQWMDHTLDTKIKNELRAKGKEINIINLGIEGAVPADMELLLDLVIKTSPDALIINTGLRSFSKDFNTGYGLTRIWLRDFMYDAESSAMSTVLPEDLASRIETTIKNFMINHWVTYRLRDYMQWLVLETTPRKAADNVVDKINSYLIGNEMSIDEKDLITMLKAKKRYKSITLDDGDVQKESLKRIVSKLNENKIKTIFFYGRENPKKLKKVISEKRYKKLLISFENTLNLSNESIQYISPEEIDIPPDYYLDMVHVNSDGYRIYAKHIVKRLSQFN